jgi:hypothetical protein
MSSTPRADPQAPEPAGQVHANNTAAVRPTEAQRRYLERGLSQPGGKLPLFDTEGREVPRRTIDACIAHGWAEPWFQNPLKADWLVCKLTQAGYRALGRDAPGIPAEPER